VIPGIDVDASGTTQLFHERAIDDTEIETKLIPHLLVPLYLQRGRADDEHLSGPVPDQQFQGDHAGLNGLPQADIIGDQQVDPWHLQCPDYGIKLIVLNVNPSAERGMQGADVGCGRGSPAYRVEKGVQLVRRIKARGLWQRHFFDQPGPWFKLPDHLELFT
jgi:hypothetical protein